jgi:hypothetical protein
MVTGRGRGLPAHASGDEYLIMAEHRMPPVGGPTTYRIVVRGGLGARFASAFVGMTVSADGRVTHIIGAVADQSQLHRLLDRLDVLGIDLISIRPIGNEPHCAPS